MESFKEEMYQALLKREEMYRRIVESSVEAILIHCDERIVYINQAGIKLLSAFSKEEVIGKPVFDIVPEEYLKRSRERFRYILKEDKPVGLIEQKIVRYDGTLVDVEVSSTPIVYEDKPAVQAVFRDITERKIIENKLKETEQRYEILYNTISGGIILKDSEGTVLHANEEACKILGVETEEIQGGNHTNRAWEFFKEDGCLLPVEETPYMVVLRTGKPIRNFVMGVQASSQSPYRWVLTNYEPIFNIPKGPPTGVVSTFLDITELKQTQKKLEESEERYRLLIEHLPDIITVGHDGLCTFINKSGAACLGVQEPEKLIGQNFFDFVPEEYHGDLENVVSEVEKGKMVSGPSQYKIVTLDNQVIDIETIFIPITYEGKPASVAVSRNITERKQMEEVLRKTDALSIAGNLAAGVAHEVRNPLTVIQGFIQLFKQQDKGNKEFLDLILEEVERIKLIIDEFLMLSKPQTYTFKKNDIQTIIEHTVALFETQAIMKNIEIITLYEDNLPLIKCEENQLKQVFINLLKNAVEAMPQGGVINVEVKKNKEGIFIYFTDQGCGISPERIKKLGEPFYTTKEKGTGLGLMVSYNIIKNHNGKIKVTSNLEQGTSFQIFLPG